MVAAVELSLFAWIAPKRSLSIQQRFEQYHAANPQILGILVTIARDQIALGKTRIAIGELFERLRNWETTNVDRGDEPYRLNNDFRSRYVRMMIDMHPHLRPYFEIRSLKSK
jgi:hypothetical protein